MEITKVISQLAQLSKSARVICWQDDADGFFSTQLGAIQAALPELKLLNCDYYSNLLQNPLFAKLLADSQQLLNNDWKNEIPTAVLALDYDSVVNPRQSAKFVHQQKKIAHSSNT